MTLPAPEQPYRFTPVPRRGRADGWTSDRQHAFVWALATIPSVTAAAASVGMSKQSAYRLRNAPGAEAFARAWDEAYEIGRMSLRDDAIQRAFEPVETPIFYRGRVVGMRRHHDNRLLVRTLIACERDRGVLLQSPYAASRE